MAVTPIVRWMRILYLGDMTAQVEAKNVNLQKQLNQA